MPSCHATRDGKVATLPKRKIRRYGWRPDLPDCRDQPMSLMAMKLPQTVDLRPNMPGVYDQGELGSCTANAIGGAYEYMQKKAGLTDYVPSRLFIYYGEREIEHTLPYDAGAEIRDGMKVVEKLGAPHEDLWPYHVTMFSHKPPQAAYDDGLMHQCIKYRRVAVSEAAVKLALAQGYPVVFGFTVYESFESDEIARTGMMSTPKPSEEVLGGHAVLAVGYEHIGNRLYAIVRNSWGKDWGAQGYFYMPMAWMCDTANADDFWALQSVEAP